MLLLAPCGRCAAIRKAINVNQYNKLYAPNKNPPFGRGAGRLRKNIPQTHLSVQRKSCPIAQGKWILLSGYFFLVPNLLDGQVLFFGEIQITEGL